MTFLLAKIHWNKWISSFVILSYNYLIFELIWILFRDPILPSLDNSRSITVLWADKANVQCRGLWCKSGCSLLSSAFYPGLAPCSTGQCHMCPVHCSAPTLECHQAVVLPTLPTSVVIVIVSHQFSRKVWMRKGYSITQCQIHRQSVSYRSSTVWVWVVELETNFHEVWSITTTEKSHTPTSPSG